MTIYFFLMSLTSSHLHPLQVENCDSNSRLVVDEDDYGKFRLETVDSMCWPNIDALWFILGSVFSDVFMISERVYLIFCLQQIIIFN